MSLTIEIKDAKGAKAGTFDLPAEIFDVQVNVPLIHQVVTAQLNAARAGTAKTKNRGVVRSLSSRRELEELVRVQLVLQINAMVVLLKDQFLVNTMSALLRK